MQTDQQDAEAIRAIGAAIDYLEIDTLNEPEAVQIMADLESARDAVRLMLDALRAVLDFEGQETGENDFCECTIGHTDVGTVCRSCFALNAARAAIAAATGGES